MKKRALVTGGAGLIGSHLVDLLVKEGYDVTILDNLQKPTHLQGKPPWLHPQARFIRGDVCRDSDLSQALEGVQFVFHQAAFGGFTEEVSQYVDVNVSGTARIFEKIETGKFQVKKIVVASSQAVYGEGAYECPKDGRVLIEGRSLARLRGKQWEMICPRCGGLLRPVPTDEDKLKECETPYALSKEFEERLALASGKHLGLPVAALRYGVTYGPRQSIYNPYTGVVSIFATRLLNDLPPLVYEDGNQTRDFVFVGDIARANLFVMENDRANFQVFNVGTGRATRMADLARRLSSIFGKSIEPDLPGEFRLGDVRHVVLDSARLKKLGFSADTPLEKGLSLFAAWMKSQGPVQEYFTQAHKNPKKNGVIHD